MINDGGDKRFLNSLVKIFKFQFGFSFFPKEVHQQSCLCFFIHMLSEGSEGNCYNPSQLHISNSDVIGFGKATKMQQTTMHNLLTAMTEQNFV